MVERARFCLRSNRIGTRNLHDFLLLNHIPSSYFYDIVRMQIEADILNSPCKYLIQL